MTPLEPLLRELIGQALRRRRREHGRTLADVAAQAGMSMQHLSDVERGRKDASSEMLAAICGALGLTLAQLMQRACSDASPPATWPVVLDLTRAPRVVEPPRAPSSRGVMLSAA